MRDFFLMTKKKPKKKCDKENFVMKNNLVWKFLLMKKFLISKQYFKFNFVFNELHFVMKYFLSEQKKCLNNNLGMKFCCTENKFRLKQIVKKTLW